MIKEYTTKGTYNIYGYLSYHLIFKEENCIFKSVENYDFRQNTKGKILIAFLEKIDVDSLKDFMSKGYFPFWKIGYFCSESFKYLSSTTGASYIVDQNSVCLQVEKIEKKKIADFVERLSKEFNSRLIVKIYNKDILWIVK